MLTDALLTVSRAQAVTATAVSTDTIDLGPNQNRDIAAGQDLYFQINVDATATSGGATTVQFQVITSAAANLSSPTVIAQTEPIGKAELTAGRYFSIPIANAILAAQSKGLRYMGIQYTVATGPLTAGAFSATITKEGFHEPKNYSSGFFVA